MIYIFWIPLKFGIMHYFATPSLSCGETHDAVHWSFINLMKLPNVETLIFWVPASNHFMF